MQKVRVKFEKSGSAVYLSHLDLMRAMSRSISRAKIPVYYTEGFNPIPHLVFSQPLALGFSSLCELVDFRLVSDMEYGEISSRLAENTPAGIEILRAYEPATKLSEIGWAAYESEIEVSGECDEILEGVRALFEAERVIIEKSSKAKKGKRVIKEVDIRPMIGEISVICDDSGLRISSVLRSGGEQVLSPAGIISAIERHFPGVNLGVARHTRIRFFSDNLLEFE